MTAAATLAAAAVGVTLDRLLGEPPDAVHPVAAFGRAMGEVETAVYRPSRAAGSLYAAGGVLLGAAAGRLVRSTAVATYVAVAGRALGAAARDVQGHLTAGDLPAARVAVSALVGRDPTQLDAGEISRAVVESVAENAVDAVVAPALWGAVAGAPGVLTYRAVNTLDAMVGYRNDRYQQFGWASARLDDLANLVPARVGALLVAAVRPGRAREVMATVRRDAPGHPSPNAGVVEAAFAAALGVTLGGENRYGERVEHRALLGDGPTPSPSDIGRAVRLLDDVTVALTVVLSSAALATALMSRGRARAQAQAESRPGARP